MDHEVLLQEQQDYLVEQNQGEFRIRFLYADGIKQPDGSYRYGAFRLMPKQDEQGQWSIEVENVDQIEASTSADVSFVVDFKDVPLGYAVVNTVNHSTVITKKIGGEAVLQAKKLVNRQEPTEEQVYHFELLDEAGEVLQTKGNQAGQIGFDALTYSKADAGKTYRYQIREKQDQNLPTETMLDENVYTAEVSVSPLADENGRLETQIRYLKDGEEQTEVVFHNKIFREETQYHPFRIKKTAAENGEILDGAMFTLYQDEDCQQEITTVPANQEIPLERLAAILPDIGRSVTVYVRETTAPDGYRLSEQVQPLRISCTQTVNEEQFRKTIAYKCEQEELAFVNERLPQEPPKPREAHSPKTGEDMRAPLFVLGLIGSIAVFGIALRHQTES